MIPFSFAQNIFTLFFFFLLLYLFFYFTIFIRLLASANETTNAIYTLISNNIAISKIFIYVMKEG